MRRVRIERVALVTILLLVAGCVPVPLSRDWPERFSEQQTGAIHAKESTRAEVEAQLGPPDMMRDGGRYWVYGWWQRRGEWVLVPGAPMSGTATGLPLSSTFHALFIEFDEAGVVVNAGRGARQGKTLRFCNSQGACVEHRDLYCLNVDPVSFSLEPFCDPESIALDDKMSTFTLPAGQDTQSVPAVGPADCRLILSVAADVPEQGVLFLVDGLWPTKLWLPKDAYATVDLAAGAHDLLGCGATRARIECQPEETLWLVLGDAREKEARCAGRELRVVRQTTAGLNPTSLRRVLLPERATPTDSADESARP